MANKVCGTRLGIALCYAADLTGTPTSLIYSWRPPEGPTVRFGECEVPPNWTNQILKLKQPFFGKRMVYVASELCWFRN